MSKNYSTPTRSSPLKNSTLAEPDSPPAEAQTTPTLSGSHPTLSGRPSIISQSRRNLSSSNSIFGSGRSVKFPDNPVTMTRSPPPQFSDSSSPEMTPIRGRSGSRSASLPPCMRTATSPEEGMARSRSVKHLTCFWWKEKGSCKYSEDECLYAHYDTGKSILASKRFHSR
jgi:hypothetical protein